MSTSQAPITHIQKITPPSSVAGWPLTPPATHEKPFAQAHRAIALFEAIRARGHIQGPWIESQLAAGDYDEIERQLGQDEALSGYIKARTAGPPAKRTVVICRLTSTNPAS